MRKQAGNQHPGFSLEFSQEPVTYDVHAVEHVTVTEDTNPFGGRRDVNVTRVLLMGDTGRPHVDTIPGTWTLEQLLAKPLGLITIGHPATEEELIAARQRWDAHFKKTPETPEINLDANYQYGDDLLVLDRITRNDEGFTMDFHKVPDSPDSSDSPDRLDHAVWIDDPEGEGI
jgi:hypothetical protein